MTESIQATKELELLKQLIGEWNVGIAMKVGDENEKVVSGCGEMTAVEIPNIGINSEINTRVEGYDDFYENDLWSFDQQTGKIHVFSMTSEGDAHDHVGVWNDDKTLELHWRGTFEDQEMEEHIVARWASKDQLELKETNYSLGKLKFTTDYVFKRKETSQVT